VAQNLMNLSECEKIHKMLVWVEDCETEKQTIEVWKKLVSFVPFASMQFKCQYLKIFNNFEKGKYSKLLGSLSRKGKIYTSYIKAKHC